MGFSKTGVDFKINSLISSKLIFIQREREKEKEKVASDDLKTRWQ